jgi:hypothetical protein
MPQVWELAVPPERTLDMIEVDFLSSKRTLDTTKVDFLLPEQTLDATEVDFMPLEWTIDATKVFNFCMKHVIKSFPLERTLESY